MRTIAKYAAGYPKLLPLKSTGFGVFACSAHVATPDADWIPYPGCEPTQRVN